MKRYKIIYLELTNACNFKCDYCPIDQQARRKVVMSEEFAQNVIDQIASNNLTDFLTFHVMGEPFLHKKLVELTKYAEDRGLMVRLLTNGSLLNTHINQALFSAGLSRLEIGFRTPNDNSFNSRLRSDGLTLDEYIERVKGLLTDVIRFRPKTEICLKFFVKSHAALFRLSESHEHLTSKQDNLHIVRIFQEHILRVARENGHSTSEWNKPVKITVNSDYPIFNGITVGFSRIQDFWIREQRGISAQQGYPAKVCGCSAGFRDDFGILANGEVTTCCVDYDGRNVIGDLHKQTLMEILESDEASRIRRSLNMFLPPTEFCRECMGGPTLTTSVLKQASTVMIDIKDRIKPRKSYSRIRKRIKEHEY